MESKPSKVTIRNQAGDEMTRIDQRISGELPSTKELLEQ